jgi:hypothetical protein
MNKEQDAIDILETARRAMYVPPYYLGAEYDAYIMLLHAAAYLELRGRQ